jgi:succinate-semialdehyde dehydrogenase/glutarate-semialdehyde dehydrogenase
MSDLSPLYIDGEWVTGDGEPFDVIDPATEAVIGSVPTATDAELDRALAAAERGFHTWSGTPGWTRAQALDAIAAAIRDRATELAALLTAEQGKPIGEATGEVASAADYFTWFADEARRVYGRVIPGRTPDRRMMVLREPVGPVAAFTPNNFPWLLPARKIAAAFAAGCSVVLKSAEDTPLSAGRLAAICAEIGLPPGVLNVVTGDPVAISRRLLGSPVIRKVSLTGSVAVGKQILRLAADSVKRVSLELGGHAPVVVLPGSNPVEAATGLVSGKFRNCGQVCVSPSRAFVDASVYDDVVDEIGRATRKLVIGPGADPNTDVGPLVSARRIDAVRRMVDDARDKGATVVAGGARAEGHDTGFYYQPTVLTDVDRSMSVMVDEPFGPILPVLRYEDVDDAIAEANSLDVGLAGYVHGPDQLLAERVARRLAVGIVGVNTYALAFAEAPFGGVRESGHGSEGGAEGIEEYLNVRYLNVPC